MEASEEEASEAVDASDLSVHPVKLYKRMILLLAVSFFFAKFAFELSKKLTA